MLVMSRIRHAAIRLQPATKSGQDIPKNRCRTTIAEADSGNAIGTALYIGDQVVCFKPRPPAPRSRSARTGSAAAPWRREGQYRPQFFCQLRPSERLFQHVTLGPLPHLARLVIPGHKQRRYFRYQLAGLGSKFVAMHVGHCRRDIRVSCGNQEFPTGARSQNVMSNQTCAAASQLSCSPKSWRRSASKTSNSTTGISRKLLNLDGRIRHETSLFT